MNEPAIRGQAGRGRTVVVAVVGCAVLAAAAGSFLVAGGGDLFGRREPGVRPSPAAAPPVAPAATGRADPRAAPQASPGIPSFDIIRVDPRGDAVIAGRGPPNADVVVTDEAGRTIGTAKADAGGDWVIVPDLPLPPGSHRLTVAAGRPGQPGAAGTTVAVNVPARPAAVAATASGGAPSVAQGKVTVEPGNSLWSIARRSYGAGTRYTVIYAANRGTIKNPDLIYPGQVVTLPAGR